MNIEEKKQIYNKQLKEITENRSESLIGEIKSAFADVQYPENEYISGLAEHNKECEEHRECYDFFVGKKWHQTLDEKSYRKLCGGQSYFNDSAWHYYLQAYLIQCISLEKFDSSNFRPLYESDSTEVDWNKRRAKLLTAEQCKTIVGYLEMVEEIWRGIDSLFDKWNLEGLNYWRENYQKALAKEQNLNR